MGNITPPLHNLPRSLTSFIGREREKKEIQQLISASPLVTLTGAGGCGKTRLALQVAADVLEEYPQGVWLVELAGLSDPSLLVQTVATMLGLSEAPGQPLLQTLTDYLKPIASLLLLDNCEHLLHSCADLADTLLRACPNLSILATSREGLHIGGEQIYPVSPLQPPDIARLSPQDSNILDLVDKNDAVRLFVERASQHQPAFALTQQNALAVASICHRLDGIPLAIELAAARMRALTAAQIASRLEDRFRLLTGGSRTVPLRQQTLQAALDWSYDLLTGPEQHLMQRLSVFVGGWTLEAAENVCAGESVREEYVSDLLTLLVDKSLVSFEAEAERYRLLETIRQYAVAKLAVTGEEAKWRSRHLDFFLALAESAESHIGGPDQTVWLEHLEVEHDNLRWGLQWCKTDGVDAELGMRLTGALWDFWLVRGYWSEGREYLNATLSQQVDSPKTPVRGKALAGAGVLAWRQGDNEIARSLLEKSLAVYRELGDKRGIAASLGFLGNVVFSQGDSEMARDLYKASVQLYAELGDGANVVAMLYNVGLGYTLQGDDVARELQEQILSMEREIGAKQCVANSLGTLGIAAVRRGNYADARAKFEEGLAISRELGDKWSIAAFLISLGNLAYDQQDNATAFNLYEESLAIRRELGDKPGIADSLNNIGNVFWVQENLVAARAVCKESLAIRRGLGNMPGIANSLEVLGGLAASDGQKDRAARLWAAAQALREAINAPLLPKQQEAHDLIVRDALGEEAFEEAWEQGKAMTIEQAIEYALRDDQQESNGPPAK